MHGLEDIKRHNEDPAAYHRSREPQHGRHTESSDTNRSFESNLADKRRRDQAFHGERVGTASHASVQNAEQPRYDTSAPEGTLRYAGKSGDDFRAVPAEALVEGRVTYHGEFHDAAGWNRVHSIAGPVFYASPEAALSGAKTAARHAAKARV